MGASAEPVAAGAVQSAPRPVTLKWFVKRTLVGIVILVVSVGGMAWLTYASIDPSLETGDAKVKNAGPSVVQTGMQL